MRNIVIYISLIILIIGVFGCTSSYHNESESEYIGDEVELCEEELRKITRTQKSRFASAFNFEGGNYGYHIFKAHLDMVIYLDGPVEELVFVHSIEDSKGFPSDVLVAWPGEGTVKSLEVFNYELCIVFENENNRIVIPEGLTLPITLEDLVDRWDLVFELFYSGGGWEGRVARAGGLTEEEEREILNDFRYTRGWDLIDWES